MEIPVFLSLGHHFSKQHVQCSMKPLDYSVSRRSIWSCAYLVNLHELTELLKQVRLKTRTLVCQYLAWHAKFGKHVYHQGLSYRYGLLISNRQSFRPSGNIVYRCQYIFVPFTGYRMRPVMSIPNLAIGSPTAGFCNLPCLGGFSLRYLAQRSQR